MLASGHFQDAIEPPSTHDIVLLILWSRLGTPLPERTAVREYRGIDGRVPVTGTEKAALVLRLWSAWHRWNMSAGCTSADSGAGDIATAGATLLRKLTIIECHGVS
jgi:hypothetical protein